MKFNWCRCLAVCLLMSSAVLFIFVITEHPMKTVQVTAQITAVGERDQIDCRQQIEATAVQGLCHFGDIYRPDNCTSELQVGQNISLYYSAEQYLRKPCKLFQVQIELTTVIIRCLYF